MTPEVEAALDELRAHFPGHRVECTPEQQGGAYMIVHGLDLGSAYLPTATWVGFLLSFQYPYTDVYPHFIDLSVRRADSRPLGQGFAPGVQWPGWTIGPAVQVSRRSQRWNPATDTAALKLAKVLDWIQQR